MRRALVIGAGVLVVALAAIFVAFARGSPWTATGHSCGGHERWDVKVLIDPDAGSVNFTPQQRSVDWLRSRPRPPSAGYGAPRVPAGESPVERRVYRVYRVYLVEAKREKDKDIHLVIRDKHKNPTQANPDAPHTMIVEFPDATCPDAAASAKAAQMQSARDAFVAACGTPSSSHFTELRGRATIEGVGFFDVVHATPQRGKAPNNIELHPVLRFASEGCERP